MSGQAVNVRMYARFNSSEITGYTNITLGTINQHCKVCVIRGLMMSQSQTIFQKLHFLMDESYFELK